MSVSAKDNASGKTQSITISGASTLDETEIDRMVKEAEANAEADRQRRQRIEAKNTADSVAYQAEKQLADLNGQVPEADKQRVGNLVKDLREASQKEDVDRMQMLTNEVQQALMQIGSAIYGQAQSGQAQSPEAPSSGASESRNDNDVIDAEFVSSK